MKTVIFVLAAIVAVNAQSTCVRTPVYTETIDPVVCPKTGIKLPNYENAQTYYQCGNVGTNGTLTNCTTGNYFSYVMQTCGPCESYLPSTVCSALPFNATCVPIGSATTAPPATTAAPTVTTAAPTVTTAAPTVSTAAPSVSTAAPNSTASTAAPTTQTPSTTTAFPQPPTDAPDSTTAGGSGDGTPSGTTIFIPQPPSPGESNVPTPVTPVPTAPNIDVTPPIAADAPVDT